ncbi:MAG: transporter [Planctomycetota bacterium]
MPWGFSNAALDEDRSGAGADPLGDAIANARQQGEHAGHANHAAHFSTAPIGVMGDHLHRAGDWMFSYRYTLMYMDGNRDGSDSVSNGDVLGSFMVSPKRMTMQMHMFGAMYGFTDNITGMIMLPFVVKEMSHVTRMGANFTTRTQGMGDVKVKGMFGLWNNDSQHLHADLGVSLPTGSVNENDDTPMGPSSPLPYPMQLGSGTFDLLFGGTYGSRINDDLSWGAQAGYTLRLGRNSADYSFGDRANATAWTTYSWTQRFNSSVRFDYQYWANINGRDNRLNPMMVPTARTDLRAGQRVDLLVGTSFYTTDNPHKGVQIGLEVGFPLFQHLDGPQLGTDFLASLRASVHF